MNHIKTFSGDYFDFRSPETFDYKVGDIAHALSMICRFTGHVNRHYSVAQHSVVVSYLVPHEFALEGLLHDAAEAFIGDVSSPLKAMLPEYKAIEHRVEAALFHHLGIKFPLHAEVKRADLRALDLERRSLMTCTPDDDNWWPRPPVRGDASVWDSSTACWLAQCSMSQYNAKRLFLQRYKELT